MVGNAIKLLDMDWSLHMELHRTFKELEFF